MGYRIIHTRKDGERQAFLAWLSEYSPIFMPETPTYVSGYIFDDEDKANTEAANCRECWPDEQIAVEHTALSDADCRAVAPPTPEDE